MNQRTQIQQFCKNHPNQPGLYFLSEKPWIKFCSQCALNMALCGKRIDKDLSISQFDNKNRIWNIAERIKSTLQKVQVGKTTINQLASKIETITKSELGKVVYSFDEYVRHLCDVRDEILQIFESSFPQSSQGYFERQTKMLLSQIQLKKNLQYIQTNYRSLIQQKNQVSVPGLIQQWNSTINITDSLLPKQSEQNQLEQFLQQRINQIKMKLSNVEPFNNSFGVCYKKVLYTTCTETPMNRQHTTISQLAEDGKENIRKATLKLRSKSKQSEKKVKRDDQSIRTRKSIKDITNFQIMESFQL